ncbi:MAG: saccharopine dehydrogenase NADP-binding domain-containing protein [Saprospiraceae bacterium]|nr:saccharopine dehydrogenase NADP-binding domain-containing protein [Saprospiraceae bacterium]
MISFMIYGANGFVGQELAREAVSRGLQPILAGRNKEALAALASELDLVYKIFDLRHQQEVNQALRGLTLLMNCAGPFKYTYQPLVEACLKEKLHYLDITGEIPVFQAIQARDAEAKSAGVMLMPGSGFDVVPTDCLALYLKNKLPAAVELMLAYHAEGPARLPPGTAKTSVEMIPFGINVRVDGNLKQATDPFATRMIDFGSGPREAIRLNWGDVFTAFYSTGIPNISNYAVLHPKLIQRMKKVRKIRFLFRLKWFRARMQKQLKGGSTPEQRAQSTMHVWGEVKDPFGNVVQARLHGPEAGVVWTVKTCLDAIQEIEKGRILPGFQTPASVFGADFVLTGSGIIREDVRI